MITEINQVDSNLKRIEEIPDTFFKEVPNYSIFGYELLPDWFKDKYGNRQDGLYKKAKLFFIEIKKSKKEEDIIAGYTNSKNISEHCKDVNSTLFYCEKIDPNLFDTAKNFFIALYSSLDSDWLNKCTETKVLEYLKSFKRINRLHICPVCHNEPFKSNKYENRGALDHWLCKSKYPLTSVHFNNLIPLGDGCNCSKVKGEKEIIWTDDKRSKRQSFMHPYSWNGELEISLICLREPTPKVDDFGDWKFNFKGQDANHQDLIDKWNNFFKISDRWIEETLIPFIENWTGLFYDYILAEEIIDIDNDYDQALKSFKNSIIGFYLIPYARVHWFFLDFIINKASVSLYDSYKTELMKLSTL
ncbi:hypothetical protein [Lutibacter citreus]|uniref:hypothetical protein n=1 Tax=Lutibacter citreus TaxID=2138210 RepID=UPI000DBE8A55|nr:hypothetical protein [Lutibacter citreus]